MVSVDSLDDWADLFWWMSQLKSSPTFWAKAAKAKTAIVRWGSPKICLLVSLFWLSLFFLIVHSLEKCCGLRVSLMDETVWKVNVNGLCYPPLPGHKPEDCIKHEEPWLNLRALHFPKHLITNCSLQVDTCQSKLLAVASRKKSSCVLWVILGLLERFVCRQQSLLLTVAKAARPAKGFVGDGFWRFVFWQSDSGWWINPGFCSTQVLLCFILDLTSRPFYGIFVRGAVRISIFRSSFEWIPKRSIGWKVVLCHIRRLRATCQHPGKMALPLNDAARCGLHWTQKLIQTWAPVYSFWKEMLAVFATPEDMMIGIVKDPRFYRPWQTWWHIVIYNLLLFFVNIPE